MIETCVWRATGPSFFGKMGSSALPDDILDEIRNWPELLVLAQAAA
jgi:hypothetical protein